jgi:S-adenosylmethionine synthetase
MVAAGFSDELEVQLAYAIGQAEPVSVFVNTFGKSDFTREQLVSIVQEEFKLCPRDIIEVLDLRKPVYQKTAAYGHFGRDDVSFSWDTPSMATSIAVLAD